MNRLPDRECRDEVYLDRLVAIGVLKDAAWTSVTLPSIAVAFGAKARCDNRVIRFIPAGTALNREYHHVRTDARGRFVRRELSLCRKFIHPDRHISLLQLMLYNPFSFLSSAVICET